jgi:hypothetical protein
MDGSTENNSWRMEFNFNHEEHTWIDGHDPYLKPIFVKEEKCTASQLFFTGESKVVNF